MIRLAPHGTITAHCPECGAPLAVRVNHTTEQEFLGCTRYPECKYTRPLSADLKNRLAGAPMLPGLEGW